MRVVLLLRGVNVGGVTVRSVDLRQLLGKAGLQNAATVLASGNAIVDAGSVSRAAEASAAALNDRYGRDIPVFALSAEQLEGVVANFPFTESDDATPYVVFSDDAAVLDTLAAVPTPEPLQRGNSVVYWSNPKGTSTDSPFARALTRIGRASVTTRNLRTLRKILAAASPHPLIGH